jgi:hypothetical protein
MDQKSFPNYAFNFIGLELTDKMPSGYRQVLLFQDEIMSPVLAEVADPQ